MSIDMDTVAEPLTDAQGEAFDPELHATKPDGTPATKTDGTFRKRRRDAGRRAAAAPSAPKRTAGPPPGTPKALAEQHARHVRAITENAGIALTVGSFFSPVDAYSLQPIVEPFAQALATVAQDDPRLAAALDKAAGAGGWATVIAIIGMGTVQVLHNHGKVPDAAVKMMGGKTRRQIEAEMGMHAEEMRAQAAAEEASYAG